MLENLTAVQVRCNQLMRELSEARARAAERDALLERLTAALSAFQELPAPLGLQEQKPPSESILVPKMPPMPTVEEIDGLPVVTRRKPGLAKAQ